jgi:hypothetical protein
MPAFVGLMPVVPAAPIWWAEVREKGKFSNI